MEEHTLEELIDDYLSGSISDSDRIRLEFLMATDPAIAREVEQCKEAYRFLQYSNDQRILGQLKKFDLDEKNKKKQSASYKWLIAVLIPAMIIVGVWSWSLFHFNPEEMAMKYFLADPASAMMDHSGRIHDAGQWKEAHEFFTHKDFRNAWRLFQPFTEDDDKMIANKAEWNTLLCRLALSGATSEWQNDLDSFINTTNGPRKAIAIRLQHETNTIIFRITFFKFSNGLSNIKPRLL